MNRGEDWRERLRVMFCEAWALWTPDERARLLSRLPKYQRDGWMKLIENHERESHESSDTE